MTARSTTNKDYYNTLGVDPETADEDIKRAYRRLAFQWHPDRNPGHPGATERFKEISEAYAVLIDPAKRQQYDLSQRTGSTSQFACNQQDIFHDLFTNPGASAIFDELAREFERMGMRVDRHDFQQTLFGGRTVVTGRVFIISPFTPLLGAFRLARRLMRGAQPDTSRELPNPGGFLGGLGRLVGRWLGGLPAATDIRDPGTLADGTLTMPLRLTPDEADRGSRKHIALDAGGRTEELLVTVPAGVRTGTRLRLRGKGRPAPDGSRGDLYLAIEVSNNI
jgi:curved DNA-binding protein CbpA